MTKDDQIMPLFNILTGLICTNIWTNNHLNKLCICGGLVLVMSIPGWCCVGNKPQRNVKNLVLTI